MTSREKLREVALYSGSPWVEMTYNQFDVCSDFKRNEPKRLADISDTDLRTFMLLVAEALE